MLFAIFCNFSASANEMFDTETNKSTIEEVAKFKTDFLRKQLLLNKRQYNKVYKIYIKQGNKYIKYNEKLNNKTKNEIKNGKSILPQYSSSENRT